MAMASNLEYARWTARREKFMALLITEEFQNRSFGSFFDTLDDVWDADHVLIKDTLFPPIV
jgi:hypothetical protein